MRDRKIVTAVALAMGVVMLLLPLFGVVLAADPTAEASRTIAPTVVQPGEAVGITVVFRNLLTEPRAFALMEVIPAGWAFTRGSDDASAFRPGPPPEWVWFTVGAGATKTVTYTLTVPPGAQAGNYAIGGTVTGASVENLVGGDTTITVIVRHGLTMSAAPGAGGTATDLTNASPYAEGTVVNIKAVAAAGYRFVNWTAPAGVFGNPAAAETTFTMPAQDVTVTANFATLPPSSYQLTISSTSGGSVTTPGIGTFIYAAGTVVNLVASPSAGYQFVNWTGNVGTIANPSAASTTITMNGNYAITANFAALPPSPVYPMVTTQPATNITNNSASLGMNYTVGIYTPVQVCFAYKKSTDPAWSSTSWVSKSTNGTYATPVTGLTSSTKYDFKAQLKYDSTVIEGATLQFTTSGTLPSVDRCFIATAAYGTPMAEEIQILREFRDEHLLTNPLGRALADSYYRVSPPIAALIIEHPGLKPIVRTGLMPVVVVSTAVVNTTESGKAAIVGLLVLVSLALAVWATRRRARDTECNPG